VVNGKPSPLGVNIYHFPSLPKNRSFVHRSARQVVAALADVFGLDDAAPIPRRAQVGWLAMSAAGQLWRSAEHAKP
jgi:hypothetical protein